MAQVAAMLTRDTVLAAIGELERVVSEWEADEAAPRTPFAGGLVKCPNHHIELASLQLIQLCDAPEAEDDAKPLVLAVDRWEREITQWAVDLQNSPTTTNPRGTDSMWQAYEDLLKKREPRRDHTPAPVKVLMAGGVSPNTIALTYGFFENGEPCVRMVFEESDNPGTHYDPDTWRSPSYLAYLRKVDKAWRQRAELRGGQRRFEEMVESAEAIQEIREAKSKQAKATPEAPEPLDNLIRDGVHIAQILRMKPRETEESVMKRAAELGVALDADAWSYYNRQHPRHPAERQQEQEDAMQDAMRQLGEVAQVNTYAELGSRDARILAMHGDGLKSTEISNYLIGDYPELTRQRVQGLIQRAKESGSKEKGGSEESGEEKDGQG